MTAVLAWRPHYKSQKPLSCSVQSLEIFSCNLSCEDDTALSIIDPMAGLIELNATERLHKRKTQGLLDATLESLPSLEVVMRYFIFFLAHLFFILSFYSISLQAAHPIW